MKKIAALNDIIASYDVVFCDVWGVIHNGVDVFWPALHALKNVKNANKTVVLLTNSPRPHEEVEKQLKSFTIDNQYYDYVVTSGDVTRDLIKEAPRKIFHIGPERDLSLFNGLDIELVEDYEALAIVCTGLFDDICETPKDYQPLLEKLRSKNLPFICANPDIFVHRGNNEVWCAGAIAREYALLGGRTLIAGKPHKPIYALAQKIIEKKQGLVTKNKILAIGDGMLTDIKGAELYGLDVLYISGGMHYEAYSKNAIINKHALEDFIKKYGHHPLGHMWALH